MNKRTKNSPRARGHGDEEAGGSMGTPAGRVVHPGFTAGAMRPAAKDVVTSGYGCLIAQASRKNGRKVEQRSGSHG